MGYDYCFLITGDKDGQTHELKYFKSSGTYNSTDLHYFYNNPGTSMNYQGTKDMGLSQYVNRLEDLRSEYLKITEEHTRVERKIRHKVDEFLKNPIMGQTIDDLVSYLEKMRPKCVPSQSLEEFHEWTEKCQRREDRGYSDVKLIYGFHP